MADLDAQVMKFHTGQLTVAEADKLRATLCGIGATNLLDVTPPDPATRYDGPVAENPPATASAGPDTAAEGASPLPSAARVALVAAALPASFTLDYCPTTHERDVVVRAVLDAAAAVDAAGLGGAQ